MLWHPFFTLTSSGSTAGPDTHDGWKKRKEEDSTDWREKQERRMAMIRAAVETVTAPIVQEIREAYPAATEAQPVDYDALARDAERVERLLEAYQAGLDNEFAVLIHFF
jgi:hypothetical protein